MTTVSVEAHTGTLAALYAHGLRWCGLPLVEGTRWTLELDADAMRTAAASPLILDRAQLAEVVTVAVHDALPGLVRLVVEALRSNGGEHGAPLAMDRRIVEAVEHLTTHEGRDHARTGEIAHAVGFASNRGVRPYLLSAQERGWIVEKRPGNGCWRVVNRPLSEN